MSEVYEKAALAKKTALAIADCTRDKKDAALARIAASLLEDSEAILAANEKDMEAGKAAGMTDSVLDRLMLSAARIQDIAHGVEEVIALSDPVGEVLSETVRPNGMAILKVRVPFGVIAMIYEARPNVTVDSAALALKTGNCIVLRGSSSAIHSNKAIVASMRRALRQSEIPEDTIQLIEETSREAAAELMHLNQFIDVLIPRGSAELIQNALQNATVPILETGVGNCHIFVDESALPGMALPLVINAKTQRPSVCNAAEKLLVHENWPSKSLKQVLDALADAGVELRCCDRVRALFPDDARLQVLPESDYAVEYHGMTMGVKIVDHVDAAIDHINTYGSHHTDAIITESSENANRFLMRIDSAAVNHNVSTRFTDGFEYGFGAEIGISTQKLHARGPMGLPELTSYKYLVLGSGQVRS